MSVWQISSFFVLGAVFLGLGLVSLVTGGEPFNGWIYVAVGVAWIVMAFLRHKGIVPTNRRPPPPNPYQENLPG